MNSKLIGFFIILLIIVIPTVNAGEFPLWLAPLQVVVIPITDRHLDYARKVYDDVSASGIRAELDDMNEKVGYKIREWETKKVPFMLVVGDKEQAASTVSVREHRKGGTGTREIHAFVARLVQDINNRTLTAQGDHP